MNNFFAYIVADREEEDKVAVDAEETRFVDWGEVSWRVKEVSSGRGESSRN